MSKRIEGRGALSPVVVFVGLVALVAAITGTVLLTREPPPPPPDPGPGGSATPTPDQTLTDEEAIALLARLDRRRQQALEQRDVSLLRGVVASDGPAFKRLKKSIGTLRRDNVRLEHRRYKVLRSEVLERGDDQIRLRQVVVVDLQFYDGAGNRITKGTGIERQVLEATLRVEEGKWLFYNGRLTAARAVK